MNKQEFIIVVLLFALLLAWGYFRRTHFTPPPPKQAEPVSAEEAGLSVEEKMPPTSVPHTTTARKRNGQRLASPKPSGEGGTTDNGQLKDEDHVLSVPSQVEGIESKGHLMPEKAVVLSNSKVNVTVSSWGGAITRIQLKNFRETLEKDSEPVRLDFSNKPALSFIGIPGLSTNNDFEIMLEQAGESVCIRKTTAMEIRVERTITLGEDYLLEITDVFSNVGSVPMTLPTHNVAIGPMHGIETKSKMRGISYLGLDTLASAGGSDVIYWAQKGPRNDAANLAQRFQPENRRSGGCAMFKPKLNEPLPATISVQRTIDADWVAVKNKFFVQILAAEGGGNGFILNANRVVPETESNDNSRTWAQAAIIGEVSADMQSSERVLEPGTSVTRHFRYYVGPKKYSILKKLGNHQDKIMFRAWSGWGWFRSICIALLWTLNAIFEFIPNYGVAIILLTVIVKIIFWPITHKSTESMKKMQELQPLIKELQKKHKDKPQKLQQEQMALYKEHKVNPMMGCLPMLVQIPVFIALFTVLRSAVELRFASFLWIKDLSEPEGLFAGILPIPLNILPLFMTATTILQQKLTPTTGDPQQHMMTMMMPVIFLFIFYNMPSALVLYWSVSQCLSIAQLLIQRRKSAG